MARKQESLAHLSAKDKDQPSMREADAQSRAKLASAIQAAAQDEYAVEQARLEQ